MRLAFLTGAGASRGAGGITPYDPPLGFELYEYLRNEYPETWGSLPNNFHSLFRDNFEIGMAELWDAQLDIGSRLIIDMAVYFSRFDPPDDGMDCYSRLVWFLKTRNLIPRTAFATLNYECVLDVAATRHGLKVAYLSEEPPPGNLLIWKPHGACNLLPLDEIYNINVVAKQILEGPLRPVDLPEVRRRYAAGYSIPPAMSLFGPG